MSLDILDNPVNRGSPTNSVVLTPSAETLIPFALFFFQSQETLGKIPIDPVIVFDLHT